MNIDLTGKVVLITGASGGLGKCLAIEFAKCNASIIVHYNTNIKKAHEVVNEIQRNGQKCFAINCDITDYKEVEKMVKEILSRFGRIDVLVNNAAVNPKDPKGKTPIYEISEEEWDLVIDTNLKGSFICTKWVLKEMLKQGRGSIVNISSTAGIMGNGSPVGAPYSISKAGMICLAKAAAKDVASKGIRINNIAAGPFKGPTNQKNSPETNRAMAEKIPLKRIAEPEEIAYGVIFLASDLAANITGETLNINGGWYMP